jgi:hypothetical protein
MSAFLQPANQCARSAEVGSHADGLEEENRKLQAELASLLEARRDNDDTFTVRQRDPSGTTLVDTIAPAQNQHVARAAFWEYARQHIAPKGNIATAILDP